MTRSLRRAHLGACWGALLALLAASLMLAPTPAGDAAAARQEVAPHAASAPIETQVLLTLDLDHQDPRWPLAVGLLGQVAPLLNGGVGSEALGFPVGAFAALWDGLPAEVGTAATVGAIDLAEPRLFALIDTSDPALAWDRVQREFRAAAPGIDDGQVFANRLHGIDIVLLQQRGATVLIAGMLANTLMLATDFETATGLIAVSRGEAEPLSARPEYQSLATLTGSDALATMFVDGLPTLQHLLTDDVIRDGLGAAGIDASDGGVIASRAAAEAALGKPMMLRLDIAHDVITIRQHALGGDAPVPPYDLPGVDRVVSQAWLYAAGYDLAARIYGPMVAAMEQGLRDTGDDAATATRDGARDALGFDPELHAIEVLDGPYAVAFAPATPAGVTGQFFAVVSDPVHAQGTVAELDRLAARDGMEVERATEAGIDVVTIGDGGSDLITHAVVGNEVRVAFTDAPPAAAAVANPPSLAGDPAFQTMMERLPHEATFVAFADVAELIAVLAPERAAALTATLAAGEPFVVDTAGFAVIPRQDSIESVLILAGAEATSGD